MSWQDHFNGNASEMPVLQRQAGRKEYPLSLNQQHMWFQSQLDLDSSLWNMGNRMTVWGPLDISTFVQAIQAIVDRHEILRTVFTLSDENPLQQVVDNVKVDCPVQDFPPELSQAERESRTWILLAELADPGYDLSTSPLFRTKLLRVHSEYHYFFFAFHHLLLDAFYCGQLMKEIVSAYDLLRRGETLPDKPPLQYGDFCVWQQERWNNGLMAQETQFWLDQLSGPLPELQLPTDPSDTFPRVVRSQLSLNMSAEVVQGLCRIGKQEKTTLFRVMIAAFAVFLARYSDSGEVILDIDFSTRPREMGRTMGFFANMLPVRLHVEEGETFRDLLRTVDWQLRNIAAHREFPIQNAARKLKRRCHPLKPLGGVVVTQYGGLDWSVGDLRFKGTTYATASLHDLWLGVQERSEDLEIMLAFSDELFDWTRAREWAVWMQQMIDQVVADPDVAILQLTEQVEAQQSGLWHGNSEKTKTGQYYIEEATVFKNT